MATTTALVQRRASTGASDPQRVTHGFVLNDARWLYAMLFAKGDSQKILENRDFRFREGWYAVSLAHKTRISTRGEEEAFIKRFPAYKGHLNYERGVVHGLVCISHAVNREECAHNEWAHAKYRFGNVISHVIPFARDKTAGKEKKKLVRVRGNFGAFPLKDECARRVAEMVRASKAAHPEGFSVATDGLATFPPPPSPTQRSKKRAYNDV